MKRHFNPYVLYVFIFLSLYREWVDGAVERNRMGKLCAINTYTLALSLIRSGALFQLTAFCVFVECVYGSSRVVESISLHNDTIRYSRHIQSLCDYIWCASETDIDHNQWTIPHEWRRTTIHQYYMPSFVDFFVFVWRRHAFDIQNAKSNRANIWCLNFVIKQSHAFTLLFMFFRACFCKNVHKLRNCYRQMISRPKNWFSKIKKIITNLVTKTW